MDTAVATKLAREIETHLNAFLSAKGFKCVIDGGSITLNNFTPKMVIMHHGSDPLEANEYFQQLKRLQPDKAGKSYWHPTYGAIRLIGWNTKRRKYPIVYQVEKTGKQFASGTHVLAYCTPEREAVKVGG